MLIKESRLRHIIRQELMKESFIEKAKTMWKDLTSSPEYKTKGESLHPENKKHVEDVIDIIEDHLGFENQKIGKTNTDHIMIQHQCANAIANHFGIESNIKRHEDSDRTLLRDIKDSIAMLIHTYGIELTKRGGNVTNYSPLSYLEDHRGDGSVVKEVAESIVWLLQTFRPEYL